MLTLNPTPEPFWIDLPEGARVQMRPISTPAYLEAQEASREVLREVDPAAKASAGQLVQAQVAFTRALVQRGVVAWEGIGDAKGKPVAPSPEAIDRLLDWYPAFAVFERQYAGPQLEAQAEKKGSAPSPGGSSTRKGATRTAAPARRASPARAAAKPARKG